MKKIIRFTASWCQPCKMLARYMEDANLDIPVDVVDIDDNSSLAIQYGIRSVPTLILIDEHGTEVKRVSGLQNSEQLRSFAND